jgi:alanine-glyoxylate transaminase/serine-glyoxylate transaminase/serine-pyruvate transaminase
VLVVHNETSTGVTSNIAEIREAMDRAGHDALLIVDAISSLASIPFRFDDWRVDVCLSGSQKGLMLPPGLGILCVGPRAIAASESAKAARHYFDWRPVLKENALGFYPYTPATLMLAGLRDALRLLIEDEGLEAVFGRHRRLAQGVRAGVAAWGLTTVSRDADCHSQTLTAVELPDSISGQDVVDRARALYGLSLGVGLGEPQINSFRIGHLGALNELEVLATLGGVEMTLHGLGLQVELGSGLAACERTFLDARATDGALDALDSVRARVGASKAAS